MRLKFVIYLIILAAGLLAIALTMPVEPPFKWVIWGLFVFIIAKEIFDEYRESQKPDQDAALRQSIMDRLNKIIAQLKNTV